MTSAQEDFALRSCHPLYREWCREDEEDDSLVECEDCGEKWTEQELDSYSWHCLECGHKIGE